MYKIQLQGDGRRGAGCSGVTLGSTPGGGGVTTMRATTPFILSCLMFSLLSSVLQAQAVEEFPEQSVGTNSVNVQEATIRCC